jgi:hypothetical protein
LQTYEYILYVGAAADAADVAAAADAADAAAAADAADAADAAAAQSASNQKCVFLETVLRLTLKKG